MSLRSLGVQSVHTFYLHWPDQSIPIEETLSAVQELYTSMLDKFFSYSMYNLYIEGKFKEFGICNYASWEVVRYSVTQEILAFFT